MLKKERVGIVHAHHAFTPTSLISLNIAERLGTPSVLTNHTIFIASDEKYLWIPTSYLLYPYRKYINKADVITAVSRAAANFIEHFTQEKEILVIPNGVDADRFVCPGSLDDPQRKTLKILYVGRLVYRKGVHILIRAMPEIIKEFPDCSLIIAGKGPMEDFLKMLVKSLDLKDNVKLIGPVPDEKLPALYSQCSIFALPSLYCESFGITLLEAMAAGKPVIASNVGGIPEVITDGLNGLLFRRGDIKDLAEKIIHLLSDRKLAEFLGLRAKYTVRKRYDWDVVAEEVERVYENIAN
ncbi:MAG: glycosyltransferase family 4 protein [Nitrososphaerota archaeon]|nr:glycosyltransferase family 4 protein [Candidatus Bathyarchaeota archaeon]MDW8049044.1 glycosyltransferase family 4 protein [Nitrososphaerota archaeon]